MEKITFKKLHDLVASVTLFFEKSYPIKVQYLSLCCNDNPNDVFSFLDAQDSEVMVYDEIEKMLKKKCNITDNSKIYLDEDNSFNGFERTIYKGETSYMLKDEMIKTYEKNNNTNTRN